MLIKQVYEIRIKQLEEKLKSTLNTAVKRFCIYEITRYNKLLSQLNENFDINILNEDYK